MATTTPNFGWAVPTSTDLVKDGAVAIETLGDAIDASLVDLKGGTTNQVLAKNSDTDMDFKWVADASGIPATILDAKGDLIAATAADTASRLAVGTNGQVLTADSAEATGLKWATPSSGGSTFAGAYVTGATVSVANNTLTTLAFNAETFDTNAYHDNSTNNSRITIPSGKAGYYLFTAAGQWNNNTNGRRELYAAKNGTLFISSDISPSGGTYPTPLLSFPIYLAVADYLTVVLYQSSGGNLDFYGPSMSVSYLGA
jgi:hypothetical protein